MELVKNKLLSSCYIDSDSKFNIDVLRELLIKKFNEIDYKEAMEDVIPFIKDVDSLNMWNKDFFISITGKLNASN